MIISPDKLVLKLKNLKDKIAKSEVELNQAQGHFDNITSMLKRDFDCYTIKEAKLKLEELELKEKELADEITKDISLLEGELEKYSL